MKWWKIKSKILFSWLQLGKKIDVEKNPLTIAKIRRKGWTSKWTNQKDVMNCNTSTLMWKPFSHRHSI